MMLRNLLALVLLAPVALGFAPSATMPRGLVQQRRALAPPSSIAMMASTPLSNGAKKISVPEGSSMMAACKKLGIKVPTNCKKGDCGTCTVNVCGKNIKACVGKVPPAPKLKSVLEKG